MRRPRHRHVSGTSRVGRVRALIAMCTALAVGALGAYGLSVAGHDATVRPTAAFATDYLNGIDVSSAQHNGGATINWAAVAGAGFRFAGIKATEGNYYVNPYYASDAAAAIAAGMYVAAYEFANPADSTGTAAADYTVSNAGNYRVGGSYLPLMLDLEYNPYSDVANGDECYGLTPAQMVTWITDFMNEATGLTGATPIIYTPTNWWDTCTGSSTAFGANLLWIPSYSGTPGTLPAGWSTWTMWQYTSSGSVPGITGNVDLDYWNVTAQPTAVAVEGADGQMWVQAPQLASGWQPEGGQIIAAPAVAAAPNPNGTTPVQPLFVATGTDHRLYIRSLTAGWQLLSLSPAYCLNGPAAVITGTGASAVLTVACEGTDRGLWENSTTVPDSGLPQMTGPWTGLGGVLADGPAVAPVGGVLTFFALGTNGGQIWVRTLNTGFTPQPWFCTGRPAAALQAASGITTFACQGTDHQLWEASNSGTGWTGAIPLGGRLIGGPAVAATSQAVEFFAEGTDHAAYEQVSFSGWASLGGVIEGGIGAAALS